jgi:flavin reductase (DIM6/NTAB) family NADH-FMN oxidoreductase RutF
MSTHLMSDPATSAEDRVSLFQALSNAWPRGVAVVTSADASGRLYGLTMRAVSPLSISPLTFLICVGERARSLKAILSSQAFCINYLGAGQSHLAGHFAKPIDDKFAGIDHFRNETGAQIAGATAVIQCGVTHVISSGDHRLVIGNVVQAEVHGGEPLVGFEGAYHALTAR